MLGNAAPYGFGGFDDSATVATSLQEAGYRTAFVGKYLNDYGLVPSRVTGEASATFVPAGWSDWHGLLQVPYPVGAGTYHYFHPVLNENGTVRSYEGEYQTTLLGRIARDVVVESAGEQPFFVYLSTLAPHDGLPHEPDDVDSCDATTAPSRGSPPRRGRRGCGVVPTPWWPAAPAFPPRGSPRTTSPTSRRSVQMPPLNDAEIEAEARVTRQRAESLFVLDLEVARLVDTLRATGELDDTVLMFTSDNGYFLGEHRKRLGKTLPYEPALRVPLLVAGPGVPSGRRFDPVDHPRPDGDDRRPGRRPGAAPGRRQVAALEHPATATGAGRPRWSPRPSPTGPPREVRRPPRPAVSRTPARRSGCGPRGTSWCAGPPAPSSSTTSSATPTS